MGVFGWDYWRKISTFEHFVTYLFVLMEKVKIENN